MKQYLLYVFPNICFLFFQQEDAKSTGIRKKIVTPVVSTPIASAQDEEPIASADDEERVF